MTIPHSTLTGTDLHEPKGAASATINKVYVSDGAGSGAWTATGSLAPFFHAVEVAASFNLSGTTARKLSSVLTNEISGASLGSNQVTLPAGTYYADCDGCVQSPRTAYLDIFNVTDSAVVITGGNISAPQALNGLSLNGSGNVTGQFFADIAGWTSILKGRFTLASTKVLTLRSTTTTGNSGTSLNTANFCVWKIS